MFRRVNEKLKKVVLYVISNCPDPQSLGLKKLCKLLYFSDFNYYKKNNKSITGADYLRWEYGPVPDEIYNVRDELLEEEKITISKININDEIIQNRIEIKNKENFDDLPKEEKLEIDNVLKKLGGKSGAELEELSHRDTPWRVSKPKDKIDYDLVFYRSDDFSALVE